MMLFFSNSLKVLDLVENKLETTFFESFWQCCFFASDLSRLKANVLEVDNLKTRKLYKNHN